MLKKFFENVNRKIKAPLTFVLSRKGREEMKGKNLKDPLTLALPACGEGWFNSPLTLVLSRRGREEKEEKILRKPLTLTLSRKVERELKGIHLIKSILFVFVNFGVLNV
jgi:hypothetical protein